MPFESVTFTVERGIAIECKPNPSASDIPSQWLSIFANNLAQRDTLTNRVSSWNAPDATPPAIQALYHSAALPLPCDNARLGFQTVSNGLVSACLIAFTQVRLLMVLHKML